MKPFNSREPVQKRDGRKARIIGWDAKGIFPITALVEMSGGGEDPESFTASGSYYNTRGEEDGMDLINVPPVTIKVNLWLAIALNGGVCVYVDSAPSRPEIFRSIKEFNLEIEVP